MKIGVYAKSVRNSKHQEGMLQLMDHLAERGHEMYVPQSLMEYFLLDLREDIKFHTYTHCDRQHELFDVLICVGGDGTMLDSICLLRNSNIPVLGLNTGRLGFLAGSSTSVLDEAIGHIERGNYTLDSRTLLQVESSEKLFDYNFALNDFVLHKKETSSMIVVHTYLNGEFLNSYWADGLIVSTPTGSTGYSLSCGGPIIFPKSDNFIITPIAPHNLNVRPVVVNDDFVISFEIEGRASNYMAGIDSRSKSISSDMQIAVRKADHEIQLMRLPGDNFMDTLRNKLNWGFDKRN